MGEALNLAIALVVVAAIEGYAAWAVWQSLKAELAGEIGIGDDDGTGNCNHNSQDGGQGRQDNGENREEDEGTLQD
jgi:hypothetical protein